MDLRERKKAATRAEIRRQALALIREQGYEATTTEQIAAAADVSASTFFRYFPSKEDVVLTGEMFAGVRRRFLDQAAYVPLTDALRAAVRDVQAGVAGPDGVDDLERWRLVLTVPELRSALVGRHATGIGTLAEAAAERTGRSPADPGVRVWAGACVGALLSLVVAVEENGPSDLAVVVDDALARISRGGLDL